MHFSSKDFAKTRAVLLAQVPERLHHAGVTEQFHGAFSDERGHGVALVELPSRTLSLTIGHLRPEQSTRLHRHNYETILYIVKGQGYTLVEDRKIEWKAGDAVYVPVWAWHRHVNLHAKLEAEYVACENAPLLQNLGEIALREEASSQEGHP
ncbi:cupin domain-containing protein [Stigmatella sp. ncwal1]|uniref:Cupin domain-containing protein n=1 Tax=Stigmatella ashevillensis TaxID=2995309 RepID=A0ABT5DJ01_9BACT|nr:cupin domain-containing protein [Stigmatella ashevillena]MDC0713624.1 cupin domain-containing protein [Stigmatella ashevillena]